MDARTVGETVEALAREFERAGLCYGHGTDNPWDEAAALVAHVVGVRHGLYDEHMSRQLPGDRREALERLARRRVEERVPVPYLLGYTRFAGLEFAVDERALVPRSPIGELIEAGFAPWIDAGELRRVLDMGTGGGCIAVASAVHLPRARVDAVDISAGALALASDNALRHGVQERVRLVRSDLFRSLRGERYDLIVTNPPYVGRDEYEALPSEFRHEPAGGLLSADGGLDFTLRILAAAPDHLAPGGRLVGEVGCGREVLERRLPQVPFVWLELRRGGEGVFLLEGEAITAGAAAAARVLSKRSPAGEVAG